MEKRPPWLLTLMKTETALEEQPAKLVRRWEIRPFPKRGAVSLLVVLRDSTGENKKHKRCCLVAMSSKS